MVTALRVLLLVGCCGLQVVAFSLSPTSTLRGQLALDPQRCSAPQRSSVGFASLRMHAEADEALSGQAAEAMVTGRRQAAFALAGAFTALAMPQTAPAQGLAGLRKRITGEAEGQERASERRKKDAKFNACETYQCIEPNQNTMGGTLSRVQLGGLSLLAPTKWTQNGASGDVLGSWSDGAGSSVTVVKQTTAESGIAWKRIPPGTIPAMAKSIVDLDLAQTGLKLAKLKGDDAENTGGKARYLKGDDVVMYTIGLRTPTEIEVVDVLLTDEAVYKISVAAPADKWQTVKAFLSEILASPSLPKTATPA